MITITDMSLDFGLQKVFNHLSLTLNRENRIGLVGRNGSGKTTLLKAIAGTQAVDEGAVSVEKGVRIAYMPQEVVLQSHKGVLDETLTTFEHVHVLELERIELEKKLDGMHDEHDIERYAHVQHELAEHDYNQCVVETKKVLAGLGLGEEKWNMRVDELSVGWRMRVVLAKLLLQKADFYLFDEPTNHLDIVAKDWFLQFLKNSRFGFMLVCHDRYFLDHLCTKIFELENGNGTLYHTNYTGYETQKEERMRVLEATAERQEKEIAQKLKTVERFRYKASKARQAQSMLKSIEKIERIEVGPKAKTVAFSFPPIERSGRVVLDAKNLSFSFGDKKIFENVSFYVERGEKVAIVAANGIGKTTLFNVITGRLPLQTGMREFGHNVSHELFEQDQDAVLTKENTILDEVEGACTDSEIRANVRGYLGAFLFSGDDIYKKIRVLSGGEKNRVAMTKVLLQHANLLLLDEPTNHLDLFAKEVLLNALRQFKGTVLFVSHDRDFLDKLATRIIELSPDGVTSYPGNYESYVYHKAQKAQENKPAASETVALKVTKKDNKEQYVQRKVINKLESKIDKLEKEIDRLNHKLAELEYGTDEYFAVYDRLKECQKSLDETISEWESYL